MMARLLLFIKHHLPWLWVFVDWVNARLYSLFYRRQMVTVSKKVFSEFGLEGFEFRALSNGDLPSLESLLHSQGTERLRYFQPHGFDQKSLRRMMTNPAFMMFGVFADRALVGYFFLRCFWNRKCFVGRVIDQSSEGRGIGRVMNNIMYEIAWRSRFRCMTTISRKNAAIMRSHRNNPHARTIGGLANDYLLVEFVRQNASDQRTQQSN
jgi:hypothetical protein